MIETHFGRMNERGNVDVLDLDGCPISHLPDTRPIVYPVGSNLGAGYQHDGIELTTADAGRIGLWVEDISDGEGPSHPLEAELGDTVRALESEIKARNNQL